MRAVAIDGPAGAGKSTIAKKLAGELGFIYVDTGALYRAIGYFVLSKGGDVHDAESIAGLLTGIEIELRHINTEQRVFLNGNDITNKIRTEAVSMAASAVSAHALVRDYLMDLQRDLSVENDVVMDGRDIGSVVLPNADIKIYLTASPEERAMRRYNELCEKGIAADYNAVLEDLYKRDSDDTNRAVAPLKAAEGAIIVDTTGNTLEQSIELLSGIVRERL